MKLPIMFKIIKPLFHVLFLLSAIACNHSLETPSGASGGGMANKNVFSREMGEEGRLSTISGIFPRENGDIEIRFSSLQSVHLLQPLHPNFEALYGLALEANQTRIPLRVFSEANDIISHLNWPTPEEIELYKNWYKVKFTATEPLRNLNVLLPPPGFNNVNNQDWDAFKKCTKVLPSLAAAQTLFNYCMAQGCNSGSSQTNPCISFQYVGNGCFARAHKMRQIIETTFKYCSEKVFSYGWLQVKANKLGGCCTNWWYHVAPLVRVKTANTIECYVIDPSMFTRPVLLSEWLQAQKNTACDTALNPDIYYAITPSAAYMPDEHIGGNNNYTYIYDDLYNNTDYILTQLRNALGCE
jgi:hypothetical protein